MSIRTAPLKCCKGEIHRSTLVLAVAIATATAWVHNNKRPRTSLHVRQSITDVPCQQIEAGKGKGCAGASVRKAAQHGVEV